MDQGSASGNTFQTDIPLRALRALAGIEGLEAGPLSPLARLASPEAPADREGMIAALEAMDGDWQWAVPALIDPGLTAAVFAGDGMSIQAGQYLWPDAGGGEPGFRVESGAAGLRLAGPVSISEVAAVLEAALDLGGVTEAIPLSLSLTNDQLWALAALVDTYVEAAARKRIARATGPPGALSAAEIFAAWQAGNGARDPSWSVALFSMLRPEAAPPDFGQRLPEVLSEMTDDGLLAVVEDESGNALEDIYIVSEELDILCRALSSGSTNFGLVIQRLRGAGEVEITAMGGWRTAGGVWLADMSALPEGGAELSLLGPGIIEKLLPRLFSPEAVDAGAPDDEARKAGTSAGCAEILAALRSEAGVAPAAAGRFCPACGEKIDPSARFCTQCGTAT